MSQSDQPAFLAVGTEVSAKFKGAFCEAKIKKIKKSIKCKVQLKEAPFKMIHVMDDAFSKGAILELNQIIEVEYEQRKLKGMIMHIKDRSSYDVVFNDGDEKTLSRTAMVMKGGKHYDTNLDQMPLYNPEQYLNLPKSAKKQKRKSNTSTPSKRSNRRGGSDDEEETEAGDDDEEKSNDSDEEEEVEDKKKSKKREKRAAASAASLAIGDIDQNDTETELTSELDSNDEKERKKADDDEKDKKRRDSKVKEDTYEIGDTVCVFNESSDVTTVRGGSTFHVNGKLTLTSQASTVFCTARWYPAVVVAQSSFKEVKARALTKKEIPVRSFKDGRFLIASTSNLLPFNYVQQQSKKSTDQFSNALRTVIDYALLWIENETLPKMWNAKEIFGDKLPKKNQKQKDEPKKAEKKETKKEKEAKQKERDRETPSTSKDREKEKNERRKSVVSSSSESSSEESEDEEHNEERDLFIAHLYKFHEERATPINRAPVMGGKDLDLHQFYTIVRRNGGGKKITATKRWGRVLNKMKLEGAPGANTVTLKKAYERYLEPYFQFERTLGWTVDGRSEQMSSRRDRGFARTTVFNSEKEKKKRPRLFPKKKEEEVPSSKEGSLTEASKLRSSSPSVSLEPPESTFNKDIKEELNSTFSTKSSETRSENNYETPKDRRKAKEASPTRKKKEEKERAKEPKESKDKERKEKEKDESRDRTREKRQHTMSETTTSSAPNSHKRSRTEDSDSGEAAATEGKKKRKKSMLKEKGERGGGGGASASASTSGTAVVDTSDSEDGHLPANCISNFYLGQNVRANYTGKWYDARVVEIKSQNRTQEIVNVLLKQEYNQSMMDELKRLMKGTRFFVHYLGWNSRYDEWIPLEKLRISQKDQQNSRELLKKASDNKLTDKILLVAEAFFLEKTEDAKRVEDHLKKQEEKKQDVDSNDNTEKQVKQQSPMIVASPAPPTPSPSPMVHVAPKHVQVHQQTHPMVAAAPSLDAQLTAFMQSQHQNAQRLASRQATPPMYSPMPTSTINNTRPSMNNTPSTSSAPLPSMIPNSIEIVMSNIMKIKSTSDPNTPVRLVAAAAAGIESRPRGRGMNIRSPSRSTYGIPSVIPPTAAPPQPYQQPPAMYAVPPPQQQAFVQVPTTVHKLTPMSCPVPIPIQLDEPYILVPASSVVLEPMSSSQPIVVQPEESAVKDETESVEVPPSTSPPAEPALQRTRQRTRSRTLSRSDSNVVASSEAATKVVVPDTTSRLSPTLVEEKKDNGPEEDKRSMISSPTVSTSTETVPIPTPQPVPAKIPVATSTPLEPKVHIQIPTPPLPVLPSSGALILEEKPASSKPSSKESSTTVDDTPVRRSRKGKKGSKDLEEEERIERSLEEQARKLSVRSSVYDDGASGSDTPHRSDTDDSRSIRAGSARSEAAARRLMSPPSRGTGSGRGMKKKRANRFSNMVTESRRKKKKNDDDSDDDGEGDSFVVQKDTYISMRNKMYKKMEAERSIRDVSYIGMKTLDELMKDTPEEHFSDLLDQLAAECKDIYQTNRSELMALERKKKKYMQREMKKKNVDATHPSPIKPFTAHNSMATEQTVDA